MLFCKLLICVLFYCFGENKHEMKKNILGKICLIFRTEGESGYSISI